MIACGQNPHSQIVYLWSSARKCCAILPCAQWLHVNLCEYNNRQMSRFKDCRKDCGGMSIQACYLSASGPVKNRNSAGQIGQTADVLTLGEYKDTPAAQQCLLFVNSNFFSKKCSVIVYPVIFLAYFFSRASRFCPIFDAN